MLNGRAGSFRTPEGRPANDEVLLIISTPITTWCRSRCRRSPAGRMAPLLDTTDPELAEDATVYPSATIQRAGRSLVLFVRQRH